MCIRDSIRTVHKDKPEWLEIIRGLLATEEKIQGERSFDRPNHRLQNLIGSYLQAMKIEYQDNFEVDGFKVDLYIPNKKVIIKTFTSAFINFDRYSLNGVGQIMKRVYESFEGYKPIFLNIAEFNNLGDHMSKINYLIALGIENNNVSGVYDFSHINSATTPEGTKEESAVSSRRQKEREAHEEEVVEEEIPVDKKQTVFLLKTNVI
eukprot:TRINITY_DN4028_c0_g1_i6.p2 TRINITY_DN4028_c0_g1~~TRINITY_DN4028_c0_g1_i6.p2  ORF type:complete len:207 (-),score=73.02 TRINITY_DN4028_c0_g1_i6:130-750(-)